MSQSEEDFDYEYYEELLDSELEDYEYTDLAPITKTSSTSAANVNDSLKVAMAPPDLVPAEDEEEDYEDDKLAEVAKAADLADSYSLAQNSADDVVGVSRPSLGKGSNSTGFNGLDNNFVLAGAIGLVAFVTLLGVLRWRRNEVKHVEDISGSKEEKRKMYEHAMIPEEDEDDIDSDISDLEAQLGGDDSNVN